VTLPEMPWPNRDAKMDMTGGAPVRPYPELVDGYALLLEGPTLGIKANETLADEALGDEELAASKPFAPSLQRPRLRGLAECA
jgi:hypothetical protein